MDIFLMFIFNIFTGAVIFLILSLKIEKTSSTFQEKKLRKEMGEIITEFNSTAERNITILESRISVLKKLLNESGSLKGVDFTVLDDKMMNNSVMSDNEIPEKKPLKNAAAKEKKKVTAETKPRTSKDEHSIIGTFMEKIQSFNKDESADNKPEPVKVMVPGMKKTGQKPDEPFSIIEKSAVDINPVSSRIDIKADEEIIIKYEKEEIVETVNLEELFRNTDDKYNLIARLFNEGHSVEDLSKYSGVPAGEIKLVISLNS